MKKTIAIILLIFFIFLTLNYRGCFRDDRDPLQVVKYFFECLKNNEWFLTYQVYDHRYFNDGKMRNFYRQYKMPLIERIELNLAQMKGDNARIQARMIYKDKEVLCGVISLEKSGKIWLIKDLSFD